MKLGHIELPSQSYHSSAKVIWKPDICDACREPKVSGLCPGCEQVKDQSFKSRGQPEYYIMHRHLESGVLPACLPIVRVSEDERGSNNPHVHQAFVLTQLIKELSL